MQASEIRNIVRSLYDRVGDVVKPIRLIQKSYRAYEPGSSPVPVRADYAARLIRTATPTSKALLETGPVLDEPYHVGLLECEETKPAADDEILVDGQTYTLLQTASMDLETGILFEVWYQ
ncbi:MAG: hypothetical protein ABJN40_12950 [Sneathiella sp.]